MEVTINDIKYEVPFDLSLITVGQFLLYQVEYGKDLDKKLKDILDKKFTGTDEEKENQKAAELEDHLDLEALCWYSYWTKFELVEAKTHPLISPILQQYRILRYLLNDQTEIAQQFPYEFEWKSEQWVISDFKVNPASEMSFNEIITSKEVMRQVHAIEGSKWDGIIYLCAVYCRKKGEVFTDVLVQEGSQRINELKELPLKHALSVAFFLSICVNFSHSTSVYLAKEALDHQSRN